MKTAQIEVDLPMLINHCGKLRMLSHRFVMMLSLCQQRVPRKAEYFAAALEALKGLKTTARYFVNPEAVRDNLDHAAFHASTLLYRCRVSALISLATLSEAN